MRSSGNFGWLRDELMLCDNMYPRVEYNDNDDFEDDTTLCLNLVNKQEVSDEEDEEEEEDEGEDSDQTQLIAKTVLNKIGRASCRDNARRNNGETT